MKTLKVLLLLIVLVIAGIGTYLYMGFYNIGADVPHYALTEDFIDFVKHRSIKARAFDLQVPEDLNRPDRLLRGAGNYDAMCVHCHLAPGMKNSEIRSGLYPRPPNLAEHPHDPAEEFWVIKHGIKLTGMPAWGQSGVDDDAIWDMVGLLQALPELNAEEYLALVEASEGHQHEGMDEDHHGKPSQPGDEQPHEHDKPGGKDKSDATKKESTSGESTDDSSEMKTITTKPDNPHDGKHGNDHEH